MQLLQDRSIHFTLERPAKQLFDFQEAAVRFCIANLQAEGDACVLALDTGCGKTCSAREVLLRMRRLPAVYVVPGGLCRQTRGALAHPPWGDDGRRLRVVAAESGKQLEEVKVARGTWDVLVLNRALHCQQALQDLKPELVVIDEAHQCSQALLAFLRSMNLRALFLTATPLEASNLQRYFSGRGQQRRATEQRRFSDACFYFRKTERVMLRLGTARTKLDAHWVDCQDAGAYYTRILRHIRHHMHSESALGRLLCALVVCRHAVEQAIAIADPWADVGPLLEQAVQLAGRLYIDHRNYFHAGTAAHLLAERLVSVRLRASLGDDALVSPRCSALCCSVLAEAAALQPPEADADACQPGELPGFWLQQQEYERLFHAHLRAAPSVPLWAGGSAQPAAFSSAIVRMEHREAVEAEAQRLARAHPELHVFQLHTGQTAARRAVAVQKFLSHGGERAKLRLFLRGLERSPGNEAAKAVLALGYGHVVRELYSYLARPRLLLADYTVDVGFDMHRHVDTILLPCIVPDRTTLLQIVGRASRIATDVRDQGTVRVSANLTRHTLDSFFERRLHSDIVPRPKQERRSLEWLTEEMHRTVSNRLEDELERAWFHFIVMLVRRARLV